MKTLTLLISLATIANEISALSAELEEQRPGIVPKTIWNDICRDGLPDGTDCYDICRPRMCRPPFTQCYKGECRRLGYEGQCLFKDDGAYCELSSCRWGKQCPGFCVNRRCQRKKPKKIEFCMGKRDGTACRKPCKNEDCFPPYTACNKGKCLLKPRDEQFCIRKPWGTDCKIPFGRHKGITGVCIRDNCIKRYKWFPAFQK